MTLGDVLGSARRSAAGFETWLSIVDAGLAVEVRQAAERASDTVAGFTRAAIADFTQSADEDAWGRLTRAVRDSGDPGAAGLAFMVRWQLARFQPQSPVAYHQP